jgi:hypothetical protein
MSSDKEFQKVCEVFTKIILQRKPLSLSSDKEFQKLYEEFTKIFLRRFPSLKQLVSSSPTRWSEGDVPLAQRGVRLSPRRFPVTLPICASLDPRHSLPVLFLNIYKKYYNT